jgi:hypothetical protein
MKFIFVFLLMSQMAIAAQLPVGTAVGLEFFGFDDCQQRQYGNQRHSLVLQRSGQQVLASSTFTGSATIVFQDIENQTGEFRSINNDFFISVKNSRVSAFGTLNHDQRGFFPGRVCNVGASRPWRICTGRR